MAITLDLTIFEDSEVGEGKFGQAKYLFHGYDDVYWLDTIEGVKRALEDSLILIENKKGPKREP